MNIFSSARNLDHINSYYGKSVFRLFVYNFWQLSGYFKRRGPSKKLLLATRRLQNSKSGKTALVLGSGPSLDLLVPERVKEYFDDVFVVNSYYKYQHSDVVIPDYYSLSDPNFFVETTKTTFHESQSLNDYLSASSATLIIPHLNRNQLPQVENNVLFFDDRELPRFLGGGISPLKPRCYVSMTLYKSLAMAIHLGYDQIFVLGMDNSDFISYKSNPHNQLSRSSELYFSDKMKWKGMPETSDPEVLPGGIAGQLQLLALFFGDLFMFPNERIVNLDENSFVDAFPKASGHPAVTPKTNDHV